ncbi:MAG: hypothetical protein OIN86_16680 [Candidatus Methanoperedens sp.]|nr:hypothetical protein [Candidatus Methanoperedens sp.]CAG1003553.1 hypothetical protein METP1_03083 [Methanosarcinales archaeon]
MEKITKNRWNDDGYNINTIEEGIPDNLFISRISYEPRTTGVLRKFNKDYKSNIGLFITNEKFEKFSKVEENRTEIINILKCYSFCNQYKILSASIDNPITIIIEIDKIIKNNFKDNQRINITFDITTFPRGELLTILYYLRHLSVIDTIRILYISPNEYGDWLTNGYRYSMIPPFFEGPPSFEKKRALFIITGFEYERAISLIDDLQPSFLILGKPSSEYPEEFDYVGEELIQKLKSTRKISMEPYEINVFDPFQCKETFQNIILEYSQHYDFFVAPMCPKLGLLGIYLAYEEKQNFRIIYPVPLIYNVGDYSTGCRNVYEITLKYNDKTKNL